MKKEARVSIIVNYDSIYAICIFRHVFLEHLILGKSRDEVIFQLRSSNLIGEIRYSNFGIGEKVKENDERIQICRNIIERIVKKIII